MFDLMVWSVDLICFFFCMYLEYLCSLFFNNDLVEGCYMVDGEGIVLIDIWVLMFVVGMEKDYIVFWCFVYKLYFYIDIDIIFVFISGGYNVGIISELGWVCCSYWMIYYDVWYCYLYLGCWFDIVLYNEGLWWLVWQKWLVEYLSEKVDVLEIGVLKNGIFVIGEVFGIYVYQVQLLNLVVVSMFWKFYLQFGLDWRSKLVRNFLLLKYVMGMLIVFFWYLFFMGDLKNEYWFVMGWSLF